VTPTQTTPRSLRSLLIEWRRRTTPEDLGLPRKPRQDVGDSATQEQMAWAIEVSVRYYQELESGNATPSLATIRALANKLRLDRLERMALVDAVMGWGEPSGDLSHAC
jgi:DNA-binding XRE family transcriptional regulator